MNAGRFQDVWMRQRIPEDDFFAKLLGKDNQNRTLGSRGNTGDAHLPYLQDIILLCNSHGLHRDEVSHVRSCSGVCKSTGGEYLV